MIDLDIVLRIHTILIENFGGAHGVRDESLLRSALSRPNATFDGKELYFDAYEKAASILESILINHPFIDGNKRTGYVLMRLLLMDNNFAISATQEEKYDFVIQVASGKYHFEQIVEWLKHNTESL